jgi:hypothetical protein
VKSARSERASKVVDAMTGVMLISQGLAEMGQANGSPALVVVTLVGGAAILGGIVLRRRLGRQVRYFHAMVSFFEGLTCAFVGLAYMQRGSNYIQFAWLLAASGFLVATVIHVRRTHRSSMPPVVTAEEPLR